VSYDFMVFPVLLDGNNLRTESIPYDGVGAARPYVTQRTVDVPGMPTGVQAQAQAGQVTP
jgi:hypothetical protein